MHAFILWCGFLGSWLLVAGPIYQVALKLGEEQLDREQMRAATAGRTLRPRYRPGGS